MRPSVFHYAGHSGNSQLLLENGEGGHQTAYGEALAKAIAGQASIKLIFLNGCGTSSLMDLLLASGTKAAIIATHESINDDVAAKIAILFYRNLGANLSIEESWENSKNEFWTGHNKNKTDLYREDYRFSASVLPVKGKWEGDMEQREDFPWILRINPDDKSALQWKLQKLPSFKEKADAYRKLKEAQAIQAEENRKLSEDNRKLIGIISDNGMAAAELEKTRKELQGQKALSAEENRRFEAEITAHKNRQAQAEQELESLRQKTALANASQDALVKQIESFEKLLKEAEETIKRLRKDYAQLDKNGSEIYLEAYRLVMEGKIDEAENLLNDGHLRQSKAADREKVKEFEKEINRDTARKYKLRADMALTKLEHAQARSHYAEAVYHCPDAEFYFPYARFLQDWREIEKAIELYVLCEGQYRREGKRKDLAKSLNNLGLLYNYTGRHAESEKHYLEALEIYRELAASSPAVYEPNLLAKSLNNLGILYNNTGSHAESEKHHLEALEIWESLCASSPGVHEQHLAGVLYNLGRLYDDTGSHAESEKHHIKALAIRRSLCASSPGVYALDLCATLLTYSSLLLEIILKEQIKRTKERNEKTEQTVGYLSEAQKLLQPYERAPEAIKELALLEQLLAQCKTNYLPQPKNDTPAEVFRKAQAAHTAGKKEEALEAYTIYIVLWQKSPEKEDAVRYAEAYLRRGQIRSLVHTNIQQTPAMNDFGQARDLFAALLPQDPGMAAFVLETAHSSCLEIAKSIPRGFWAFMARGQARLAKQTAEAALASVAGLALNDEARAWEGKLKVFLK